MWSLQSGPKNFIKYHAPTCPVMMAVKRSLNKHLTEKFHLPIAKKFAQFAEIFFVITLFPLAYRHVNGADVRFNSILKLLVLQLAKFNCFRAQCSVYNAAALCWYGSWRKKWVKMMLKSASAIKCKFNFWRCKKYKIIESTLGNIRSGGTIKCKRVE